MPTHAETRIVPYSADEMYGRVAAIQRTDGVLAAAMVYQYADSEEAMNEELPEMKHFIIPGGHPAVSNCHIARCVCRRAERLCVGMQEHEMTVEPLVLQYLNRLSDYLFVLARYAGHLLHVPEIPWKPRL